MKSSARTHSLERPVMVRCELTEAQALALAQFIKRAFFADYRGHAVDDREAYLMLGAAERLRQALADEGFAPR